MIRNILIYIHIFICLCLLYGTILDQSNKADQSRYYLNNFLFINPTQKISFFTCLSIIVFMVYNYLLNNDYLLGRFMSEDSKENNSNIITLFAIPYDVEKLYNILINIIYSLH